MKTQSIIIVILISFQVLAQPKWERGETKTEQPLALFHSTQTANFPTTESLNKGNFMYEISHRFIPSIKDGFEALYGFDGPARIRFALGYGITDELMVMLGRSNEMDNWDLYFKQKLFQLPSDILPSVFSIKGGILHTASRFRSPTMTTFRLFPGNMSVPAPL